MLNGIHAPNRPFVGAGLDADANAIRDRVQVASARPQVAVITAGSHKRPDADFLRQVGCQQVIVRVNPDRADIHWEEVSQAVNEFGANTIIQLGNEPNGMVRPGGGWDASLGKHDPWQLRYYLMDVLAHKPVYKGALLLPPPLAVGDNVRTITEQIAFLRQRHGVGKDSFSFEDIYCQLAPNDLAIHLYGWSSSFDLCCALDAWHAYRPQARLWITEYAINGMMAGEQPGNQPAKVAEYRRFLSECHKRPWVAGAAMFIAGDSLPGQGTAWSANYIVGSAISGLAGA